MDVYKPGLWNAACAVCGFKKKSDQLFLNWKGFYVCEEDFEYRHPSDFLKSRLEKITVSFTRPEYDTEDTDVCYMWERSGYAGLASANCGRAGNTTQTYAFLVSVRDGTQ
jgi:hypothetical protein